MSEMLGNQYFMARNFAKALRYYEPLLEREPHNQKVQKKLIICYCEMGMVKEAIKLVDQVFQDNIEIIAKTDVVKEDCPCPELVERMRWYEQITSNSFDFYCILGILSMYCNLPESLIYLKKAIDIAPLNQLINNIYTRICEYAGQQG